MCPAHVHIITYVFIYTVQMKTFITSTIFKMDEVKHTELCIINVISPSLWFYILSFIKDMGRTKQDKNKIKNISTDVSICTKHIQEWVYSRKRTGNSNGSLLLLLYLDSAIPASYSQWSVCMQHCNQVVKGCVLYDNLKNNGGVGGRYNTGRWIFHIV